MKTYITFGYSHTHTINGKTLDYKCIACITSNSAEEGREKAFELFDGVFCFEYPEHEFIKRYPTKESYLQYFPRGIIEI